jgi:hypothetical protein
MEDLTLHEVLRDIERELTDPSIIQDNKLIFKHMEAYYCVRMPNQLEEMMAQDEKNSLFGRLIQTDGYYMKKRLTQILKEKQGVDLDALEDKRYKINVKIQDYQMILAPKRTEETETVAELKAKIERLQEERKEVIIEINKYLSTSIEDQLEKTYVQVLTALCTEKLSIEDGQEKWSKFWPTMDDFKKETKSILHKSVACMSYLLFNVRSY